MQYVMAALVVVGALILFDLVLTLGVIRRLRRHSELIGQALSRQGVGDSVMLAAGKAVSPFEATTVDGEPVATSRLSGQTLVGFFSPNCSACGEQLPSFVEHAKAVGPDRVLVVAVGADDQVGELVAQLRPVAKVVVERDGGQLARAFGVKGFPAMCLITGDGTVAVSGFRAAELADFVAA
jgi:peroxiredoxin